MLAILLYTHEFDNLEMHSSLSTLAAFTGFSLLASCTPLVKVRSAPATISGWIYSGCFKETTFKGVRALEGASYFSDTLTVERCAAFCTSRNFPVFGVEYGRECFCGTELRVESLPAPETDCNFSCPGKSSDSCGAGDR